MGRVRRGPPKNVIKNLQRDFSIRTFVETGTFYGSTAIWASDHFDTVITIELDDRIYQTVSAEYRDVKNIRFVNGKSQTELQKVVQGTLDSDAVFWLDAHYSGEGTAGEDYECPLLDEIEAIGSFDHNAFVFIDDARLFFSPPPRPHNPGEWPTIKQIFETFDSALGSEYYIAIVEDVIIAVPPVGKSTILRYAQDVATAKAEQSDVKKGIKLIWKGILRHLASKSVIKVLKKIRLYTIAKKIYRTFD